MLSYGYLKEKNEKAQDRVLANQHASYRGSAKVLLSSFYHPPTNEQCYVQVDTGHIMGESVKKEEWLVGYLANCPPERSYIQLPRSNPIP
jgi:hypothetical protein